MITRKAYGGAYDVMGSKHLGADINLAWPTAQIAVMGAQGAVNILYRDTLKAAEDPEAEARAELIDDYDQALANPYLAAERGYVDAVISPHETRVEVVRALRLLRSQAGDPAREEAREHPAVMSDESPERASAAESGQGRRHPRGGGRPGRGGRGPRQRRRAGADGVRRSGRPTTARSAAPCRTVRAAGAPARCRVDPRMSSARRP